MKKSIEETRAWLLENRVDEDGRLMLNGLDFSNFDGDVWIVGLKVKGDLIQNRHEVQGNLYQNRYKVQGNLDQSGHKVQGNLYQGEHKVQRNLFQNRHEVKGDLWQNCQKVGGKLYQDYQKVEGNLYQDKPTHEIGNCQELEKGDYVKKECNVDRLVEEKSELENKAYALRDFIKSGSDKVSKLHERQLNEMIKYINILQERIIREG